MGGAAANVSYNQADLVPIVESNRFPASSGLLLRGLNRAGLIGGSNS